MPVTWDSLSMQPPQAGKVLVVDDDERIVQAFSDILSRAGWQVLEATDGLTALRLVDSESPDIVVIDVLLPDINGVEVCQRIKAAHSGHFLPVILVTGKRSQTQRAEGLLAGADDFLTKPIEPIELTARVRSLLRTKHLYDENEERRRDLELRVAERTQELSEANQRLTELNQARGRLLDNIAHQFRTPLSQAKMALGLTRDAAPDPDQQAVLFGRLEEAFHLLEYRMDDIAIFSDPEAAKPAPVAVRDLIIGAVDQVHRLHRRRSLPIEVVIPAGLPPVMVDGARMVRAIVHVIDNAVKFSDGQPVTVQVEAVPDWVLITVMDRGPGITDDVMPKLFVPLQAGDDSSTRRHDGIGLGLALVKAILDAHDAGIDIESVVGRGTRVTLALPVASLTGSI